MSPSRTQAAGTQRLILSEYSHVLCYRLSSNSPHEEMQSVEDINIPGPASELLLRIYQPRTQPDLQLSALIYFHGGGFAFGDLDSHDSICRALAKRTPCIVLAVN